MKKIRIFLFGALALWFAPWAFSAPSTVVTTPSYTAPGYIVPGNASMGSISATANFSVTFAETGNKTIRAYFQLLDESGNAVAITGSSTTNNQTIYAQKIQSFTKNTSTAVSINAQIIPNEQLDPTRTYRVHVSQVADVSNIFTPVNLGVTGTQIGGNQYIHFHGGCGVVARMATAWSKRSTT